MAKGSETGASFDVEDSFGKSVFSSPVGAQLGHWGGFAVYALDFQANCAGIFTIKVHGPFPAESPSFRIDTARKLYSQGISNALNFYQNECDGRTFIKTLCEPQPGI
jgi:hypothetical protein